MIAIDCHRLPSLSSSPALTTASLTTASLLRPPLPPSPRANGRAPPQLVELGDFWHVAIVCRTDGERFMPIVPNASLVSPPPPKTPGGDPAWASPCGSDDGILTANLILALAAIVGWARFVSLCASIYSTFGPFVIVVVRMTLNDVRHRPPH